MVNNGRKYPGANFYEDKNGNRHSIVGGEKIEIGFVVMRHPLEGERCFINR